MGGSAPPTPVLLRPSPHFSAQPHVGPSSAALSGSPFLSLFHPLEDHPPHPSSGSGLLFSPTRLLGPRWGQKEFSLSKGRQAWANSMDGKPGKARSGPDKCPMRSLSLRFLSRPLFPLPARGGDLVVERLGSEAQSAWLLPAVASVSPLDHKPVLDSLSVSPLMPAPLSSFWSFFPIYSK